MSELMLLPDKITATADQLERRIVERFPGSSLAQKIWQKIMITEKIERGERDD